MSKKSYSAVTSTGINVALNACGKKTMDAIHSYYRYLGFEDTTLMSTHSPCGKAVFSHPLTKVKVTMWPD